MPRSKAKAEAPASRFAKARTDVSKIFDDPADVLTAGDLNDDQKAELLQQWESDLRLLLVAGEENMPSSDGSGSTAERLRAVRHALHTLRGAPPAGAGA